MTPREVSHVLTQSCPVYLKGPFCPLEGEGWGGGSVGEGWGGGVRKGVRNGSNRFSLHRRDDEIEEEEERSVRARDDRSESRSQCE